MRFSLALAAFTSVLAVCAANIPTEVGANNEESSPPFRPPQSDGASILSSVASDVTGAVPTVTSAIASVAKEATSAAPSVISDITSVAHSVIGDATSGAVSAFNTATAEIPNIVSEATGVVGDASAAVGGLIGAGARIDASALTLLVGVGIALYHIVSVRTVGIIEAEKVARSSSIRSSAGSSRRAPQHIVQGHRLDIFDDFFPAPCKSLPTYLISSMWPVLIGLVVGVYSTAVPPPPFPFLPLALYLYIYCNAVLSLRTFAVRRAAFASLLSAHSALPPSCYLRLAALSLLTLLLLTPLALTTLALTTLSPWRSFADTHFDCARAGQVPRFLWTGDGSSWVAVEMTRWAGPARNYALAWAWVGRVFWRAAGRVGVKRPETGFFAPASSSSTNFKPAPPPQLKTKPISLPLYPSSSSSAKSSTSHTFTSFGDTDAELKRAPSSSSSLFSSPAPSEAGSSRFVERFPASPAAVDEQPEVEVRRVHLELDPPNARDSDVVPVYGVERHGVRTRPPALPRLGRAPLCGVGARAESEAEEDADAHREWSPASDARSVCLEMGSRRVRGSSGECEGKGVGVSFVLPTHDDAAAAAAAADATDPAATHAHAHDLPPNPDPDSMMIE
ncbi:hypothetical protein FB451DRAFT_1414908 [Mycena latifolia]|nr:hypothetical protein FB451DRAFT_1414908 [Mycena latifolia]